MEVLLERDAFLRGVQMVQNIVEPRQTLPILANILLEGDAETVRVTATDLEVGARVSVPARVASRGAVTVSARKLAEIVKELPAAALTLKVGDNAAVNIRCGGVSYRLVGLPPDDFPPVVPASPASWIPIEARALRECSSRRASPSPRREPLRPERRAFHRAGRAECTWWRLMAIASPSRRGASGRAPSR